MQNISGTIGYDVWAIRKGTKGRNKNVIQNELIKKTSNQLYMQVSGRIFIPLTEQVGNTLFEQTRDEVYNKLYF
jgi:hypothetical protein